MLRDLTDSGLLHTLLGLPTMTSLLGHHGAGFSFEGFALQTAIEQLGARPDKLGSAPDLTPSMRTAREDLGLAKLWVVHHGKERYLLDTTVEALPLRMLRDVDLG